MQTLNQELKKRIMRRVYTIWFIRKAAPLAGEIALLGVLAIWGLQYISPANILVNAVSAASGLSSLAIFFVNAFSHLSAPSQMAVMASAVVSLLTVRDIWTNVERLAALRQRMFLSS